jgi:YD repeat-containing protein
MVEGMRGGNRTRRSWLALLVALLPLAAASFALADIVYLYDDLGRLVRAIRDDGEAATYDYDPVGNLLRIVRQSGVPQTAAVTTVSTASLPRSATTTITLTGLNLAGARVSAGPGVHVTIVTAASGVDTLTLDVLVDSTAPLGATELIVETDLGAVTIPIAIVPGTPLIEAFAPAKALAGMVVTIAGLDFDPGAGATLVRINGTSAAVLEATPERLRVRVPPGATTGAVTVTTGQGTATAAGELVVSTLGAARANVTTTDLLAYWTLDRAAFPEFPTLAFFGPTAPDDADSLDLELRGNLGISPSVFGQGLDFGAISSTEPSLLPLAVRPGDDPDLNFGAGDHTYGLWARWTSTDGDQVLIEKCPTGGDCTGEGWGLRKLFDNSLRATPFLQTAPGVVTAGPWYHIAVVRQGETARLYLDGVLLAEAPFTETLVATTAPLRIGAGDPFQPMVMSGMIDEVGIWARALGAAEVQALTRVLGDGGPATAAQLNAPHGVAVDAAGTLYIADTDNHRVRKVAPDGTISTIAGDGTPGFGGDGGPATRAQLREPHGVAVDADGNVYIADSDNHRIRMVSPAGTITTVAGNGDPGFDGDGGPAASANLNYPVGVAVDAAGVLWIADTDNFRVRKVVPGDPVRTITTVAGTGSQGFSGDGGPATGADLENPWGVALDAAGNLYIADAGIFVPRENDRVRKVAPDGIITTFAGSGTQGFAGDGDLATLAQLNYPAAVAVDGAGGVYVADRDNHRIRKVTAGVISTVAGSDEPGFGGDGGLATSASLLVPSGVAVNAAGDLFIADRGNHRIRKVSGGVITTVAGSGDPGPPPSGGEGE